MSRGAFSPGALPNLLARREAWWCQPARGRTSVQGAGIEGSKVVLVLDQASRLKYSVHTLGFKRASTQHMHGRMLVASMPARLLSNPRHQGDCIDGVRFLKLRSNNGSGSRPTSPGGHCDQQYKESSSDKPNKTFMLGTDDDVNLFSLASSLDIFFETDNGEACDNDSAGSPGGAEMNAATTDVDNSSASAPDN
eukprot:6199860-Pleurochrysis_carterae.AAC.3